MGKLDKALRLVSISYEKMQNNMLSLENFVDKYLPLRMLNMVIEATEDVFNKK
jgi:hypothetical protein